MTPLLPQTSDSPEAPSDSSPHLHTSDLSPEVLMEQWLPTPPDSIALTAASGCAVLSAVHAAAVRARGWIECGLQVDGEGG